jgi:lipopolysaccharide/colanic/teichoic acid biosynthesis glycosyltransferase
MLIMILDGFPIIYSQPRVGMQGQSFMLYKFRTMKEGSDQGESYTRENDARVTFLGSFLRRTRLDELPQLWNVFRGEMSMIGPRAEWTRLVENYKREIPHYHFRHLVRPGITGWAQVNYPYGASLEDTLMKFSFDLYYIRNFSIKLDAEVLLKTIYVVLFGRGR